MSENEITISPYNYCDYRCDKCEVREKCLVYKKEKEAQYEGKSVLEVVRESMDQAMDMIHEFIQENDIDISDVLEEEDSFAKIHKNVREKHVMKLGEEYMDKTWDFLDHYREHYLLIPPALEEAFSDLQWYRTLLPVKMHRTLTSLHHFIATKEEYNLEDAYFTSFVVYKAIRKSLSAVVTLKEALVDYQDTLTELENLLVSIKNEFKHEFPFEIFISLLNPGTSSTPSSSGSNKIE
jgi:hypothetical protein